MLVFADLLQVSYLNSVVMPDEAESSSEEEQGGDENGSDADSDT